MYTRRLVILLPFVKPFFENIGLLENDAFKNKGSQEMAVQALFFLATGNSFGKEDQYLLPKILCGMQSDAFLSFESELPSFVKSEANDLLTDIIRHWDILKDTSVDGLRETFLLRSGKLTSAEGHYKLQVEKSGVDILLDRIPWGFREVKLPWMSLFLYTEWY